MLALTPKLLEPEPLAVRIVRALAACEAMVTDAPGVDPDWLLTSVSRGYTVDRELLALMWLRRLLARDAARAALVSMSGADAALEQAADAQKCIAPRPPVSRPRRRGAASG